MANILVDELLVAGGGSGAGPSDGNGSGGGGAGGMLLFSENLTSGQAYQVVVGAGGVVGASTAVGGSGGATTFNGHTALGGGGGGNRSSGPGQAGGSGGGGANTQTAGGAGTVGQGNNGGTGSGSASFYGAGGGGGAGAVGANGSASAGGNGGAGSSNSYSGATVTYAGGGGGCTLNEGGTLGLGGAGGGGNAGEVAGAGTANTGGGGGGGGGTPGAGGSGIVIVRYLTADYEDGSGGTITTSGGYTIHTFTSSSTFVAPVPISVAPTDVAAVAASSSLINISWTDNAEGAYYLVWRNTVNTFATATPTDFAEQGDQAAQAAGLTASTLYYFWVQTIDDNGNVSAASTVASATTSSSSLPVTPTILVATVLGRTSIKLTWTDGALTTHQAVYRHTADVFGSASIVDLVVVGAQTYTDTGLTPGTAYYYWLLPVGTGGVGTQTSSVNGTTTGNSGSVGEDIVNDILEAMKDRLVEVLPTDWKELEYVKDLKKNNKLNRDKGYGIQLGSASPGEAPVFGAYTQTLNFEVVLTRGAIPGKGDRQIELLEQDLYTWFDRIIRDFKKNKLYQPSLIVRIVDPSAEKPEYLEDVEMVALRYTFPIMYRNNLE